VVVVTCAQFASLVQHPAVGQAVGAGHPRPGRRLRDDRQGQHARPVLAAEEVSWHRPAWWRSGQRVELPPGRRWRRRPWSWRSRPGSGQDRGVPGRERSGVASWPRRWPPSHSQVPSCVNIASPHATWGYSPITPPSRSGAAPGRARSERADPGPGGRPLLQRLMRAVGADLEFRAPSVSR